MVTETTVLNGMKEIKQILNRSEATILEWIRTYENIPIKKINGRWESDRVALEEWRRVTLLGLAPTPKGGKKKTSSKHVNTH